MAIPQMPYKPPPPSKRKKTVDKQPPFAITVTQCKICFEGSTLIRTLEGYKPIKEICVGDLVLGQNGTFNPVRAVGRRYYQGSLLELKYKSSPIPLLVTPEHPILGLIVSNGEPLLYGNRKSNACSRSSRCRHSHQVTWCEAKDLETWIVNGLPQQVDERMTIHVPLEFQGPKRNGPTEFELTPDFLWAVGLYIAEGSAGCRQIMYTLNANETEYIERLRRIFGSYGYTTNVRPNSGGSNSVHVVVNSTVLAEWWPQWMGHYCYEKHIPEGLVNLAPQTLQPLIDGVFDGDSNGPRKLSQTSDLLCLQVAEHYLRAGIGVSCWSYVPDPNKAWSPTNPRKGNRRPYYILQYSNGKQNGRTTWWREDLALTKIQRRTEIPFEGWVYNLEVEDDPTYVAQGIVVHNCRLPATIRREIEAAIASGWAQRDIVSHWNEILANFEDYGPDYIKQGGVSTHARRHLSVTQASIRRIIEKKALEFGEDVEAISDFMLTKEAVLEAIMTTGLQDIAKGLSHVEPRELIEALKLKYQLDNQSEGIAQDELYRQFFAFQDAVKQIVSPEQRELIAAQFEKNLQTTAPRALPVSVKVPSTVIVETPVLKDENKIEVPVEEGEFTEVHEDVSE